MKIFESTPSNEALAFIAIRDADLPSIEKLVEQNLVDVNAYYKGHCLMHWVVLNARLNASDYDTRCNMLAFFLSHDANPNNPAQSRRYTPLHTAVRRGLVEMVKALLEHKADKTLKDEKNGQDYKTPRQYAQERLVTAQNKIKNGDDVIAEMAMKARFECIISTLDLVSPSYAMLPSAKDHQNPPNACLLM